MTLARRFYCTACGACCRQPGVVRFAPEEVERGAAYLELSPATFRRRFGLRWIPRVAAYELEVASTGCPLLRDDQCSIHAVKPTQCATFPFWPELIEDDVAWDETKAVCEGLDHPEGDWVSLSEMRARARRAGVL